MPVFLLFVLYRFYLSFSVLLRSDFIKNNLKNISLYINVNVHYIYLFLSLFLRFLKKIPHAFLFFFCLISNFSFFSYFQCFSSLFKNIPVSLNFLLHFFLVFRYIFSLHAALFLSIYLFVCFLLCTQTFLMSIHVYFCFYFANKKVICFLIIHTYSIILSSLSLSVRSDFIHINKKNLYILLRKNIFIVLSRGW